MLNSWWLPTLFSAIGLGIYDVCKKHIVASKLLDLENLAFKRDGALRNRRSGYRGGAFGGKPAHSEFILVFTRKNSAFIDRLKHFCRGKVDNELSAFLYDII